MADVFAVIAGLAAFAATLGGAALVQSYREAAARVEGRRASVATRARGLGGAVGGHNRPGEN